MSRVGDKVPEVTVATVVDAQPSSTKHKQFTLVVTAGPDKGRRFALDPAQPSTVLIGQSPACDIRLTDPQVSRRHASLELIGRSLRITDLGSTNGTFADRIRVVSADLQGGEFLRFGATLLRVDAKDASDECGLPHVQQFGRVVGDSAEMRRLYPLCERLAAGTIPVVIEGETGTGKEVLAESIHDMGPRASGPFVVFDCTACPPNLLEVELFGHERGAFTGAIGQRKGVFEQAHGGTLFIDEIGDLDLSLQPKLLRAIERSEVRRVGGDRWLTVDVRILAATRRNLDHEVEVGRFRDDLFHRISVARVELPPLRHRRGDVTTLARYFWHRLGGDAAGPPSDVLARWNTDPWPGNVRELRNAVARRVELGDMALVPASSPGSSKRNVRSDVIDAVIAMGLPFPQARDRVQEEFEQRYVATLLAKHDNDVAKAAEASGIGRRYFQKLRARGGH